MRRNRPFWKESDSTASLEEPFGLAAGDARGRQRVIGVELCRWYDAVAKEAVPDEWLALLDQADRNGQAVKNGNGGMT